MRITVLGCGAAIPMRGGTNSAYLASHESSTILIDSGPAILQQLDAVGLTPADLTHVYLTHRHGDHALGFPMLVLWWLGNKRPIDTFPTLVTGRVTWATLETLLNHTFGEVARQGVNLPRILFDDFATFTTELRPGLKLRTMPMVHSTFAPVSGLRLQTQNNVVVFTGDTAPCPQAIELAHGADLLFHEAAYCATLDPHLTDGTHGHSTAAGAGRDAAAAGARRLVLVHIHSRYEGREESLRTEAEATFSGKVDLARPGDVYTL